MDDAKMAEIFLAIGCLEEVAKLPTKNIEILLEEYDRQIEATESDQRLSQKTRENRLREYHSIFRALTREFHRRLKHQRICQAFCRRSPPATGGNVVPFSKRSLGKRKR